MITCRSPHAPNLWLTIVSVPTCKGSKKKRPRQFLFAYWWKGRWALLRLFGLITINVSQLRLTGIPFKGKTESVPKRLRSGNCLNLIEGSHIGEKGIGGHLGYRRVQFDMPIFSLPYWWSLSITNHKDRSTTTFFF